MPRTYKGSRTAPTNPFFVVFFIRILMERLPRLNKTVSAFNAPPIPFFVIFFIRIFMERRPRLNKTMSAFNVDWT